MKFVDLDDLWRFALLLGSLGAGYFFGECVGYCSPLVLCEIGGCH